MSALAPLLTPAGITALATLVAAITGLVVAWGNRGYGQRNAAQLTRLVHQTNGPIAAIGAKVDDVHAALVPAQPPAPPAA